MLNKKKILSLFNDLFLIFVVFFVCLQKFMFYVLKSSDVLDILVPILYHLNDARADQCELCIWSSNVIFCKFYDQCNSQLLRRS